MSRIWPMPPSILSAMGIRGTLAEHSSHNKVYQSMMAGLKSPKTVAAVLIHMPTDQQYIMDMTSSIPKVGDWSKNAKFCKSYHFEVYG